MSLSRESRRYERWNLVSTGEILCRRFIDSIIAVIRPNEMKDGTFSRLEKKNDLIFRLFYLLH